MGTRVLPPYQAVCAVLDSFERVAHMERGATRRRSRPPSYTVTATTPRGV
jgi:hypothetical protein